MSPQPPLKTCVRGHNRAPISCTQQVNPENLCPRTQHLSVHRWLRPLLLDVGVHLC